MDLLAAPFDADRPQRGAPLVAPLGLVVALAAGLLALGRLVEALPGILHDLGRAIEGAAVFGGFTAAGFVIAQGGGSGWRGPAARLTALLAVAFLVNRIVPFGSLAFLVVPLALSAEARRQPRCRGIGAAHLGEWRWLLLGMGCGVFLGGHLLIAASMTLGHSVRVTSLPAYLGLVAYDVGANALTAEWLFRGALFSLWWRRWGFLAAAGLATAAALVRYLLDPALPRAVEVLAGAIFYLSVVSLVSAALRARSRSLVPGYLADVCFFAAYRALVV